MHVNKINDDLYLFLGDKYKANSTIFVSGSEVLLVDALASQEDAEELQRFVEGELKKQVRFIVSTHYFSDHLAALNTFPKAAVFAHENYLETFESEVFRTEEEAGFFREPDVLISDRIKFRWGNHTLDVFYNPGHTNSTLTIDVPEADLLMVGDTLVGNILYLRYSTPELFLTALENLRSRFRQNVISSHGGIRSSYAIDNAKYYLQQIGDGANRSGWSQSFLKSPLEEFVPPNVTPTEFERIFHDRNLHTIIERRLFAPSGNL